MVQLCMQYWPYQQVEPLAQPHAPLQSEVQYPPASPCCSVMHWPPVWQSALLVQGEPGPAFALPAGTQLAAHARQVLPLPQSEEMRQPGVQAPDWQYSPGAQVLPAFGSHAATHAEGPSVVVLHTEVPVQPITAQASKAARGPASCASPPFQTR